MECVVRAQTSMGIEKREMKDRGELIHCWNHQNTIDSMPYNVVECYKNTDTRKKNQAGLGVRRAIYLIDVIIYAQHIEFRATN